MPTPTLRTVSALRAAFWDQYPAWRARYYQPRKRQNAYPADVRAAWVQFVDDQQRAGNITERLAFRATL